MDNRNLTALLVFFLIAAGSFHFFNLQVLEKQNNSEIDPDDFNLSVQEVETIPASESVAYGKGYRMNASISFSESAEGSVLLKYRTQRGTAAGGPAALFDYRFVKPGDRFNATLEQNHDIEKNVQNVELSFLAVRDNISRSDFEDTEMYRVFMTPADYPEYVEADVSTTSFEFSP